ncbi:HAMP domain-containing sensor histidine kinase [Miniphocaeibacter massiliensis]|uniref:HAMP domain-containing sensor histidine kinase n=1 Tax=Miniphocaeibacter massiliensis TaxID=2041841 RepID=UPI000C1BB1F5|nr:HAMP domain-containing sensor histidine kinase [Miniphocaeibacter massiliensis]
MNKKKTLFKELLGSFIKFTLLLILAFIVMTVILIYGGFMKMGLNINHTSEFITQEGEFNERFIIDRLNGWIEKIDSDNEVREVVGSKKNSKSKYTEKELEKMLSYSNSDNKYMTTMEEIDGERYLIVVEKDRIDISYNLNPIKKYFTEIGIIVFLGLYVLIIYLMSKNISTKIKEPIYKILDGMDKVKSGEKNIHIDFYSKNELNELKDNFNEMILKLEREENNRIQKEEEKNRLLLDLSHDIKTPISTIKSYSIALKDNLVDEKDKNDYYEIIDKKSSRISYLVDEMNNLLKLDSHEYKINLEYVNFSEIVRKVISEYYTDLENKGLETNLDIQEKDIYLNIEPNLIKRVLNNLIENQIKYNNGKMFEISLYKENSNVYFKIRDDGDIIDIDLQKNLFYPFTRGDKARVSSGGLGLGLSISKKIIDKHNGEIYYTDENNFNNFIIVLKDNLK